MYLASDREGKHFSVSSQFTTKHLPPQFINRPYGHQKREMAVLDTVTATMTWKQNEWDHCSMQEAWEGDAEILLYPVLRIFLPGRLGMWQEISKKERLGGCVASPFSLSATVTFWSSRVAGFQFWGTTLCKKGTRDVATLSEAACCDPSLLSHHYLQYTTCIMMLAEISYSGRYLGG